MRRLAAALALCAAGCGPDTALWLRVEAPLAVPQDCDTLQVEARRGSGAVAFQRTFPLSGDDAFPLTLSLVETQLADVGMPLQLSVAALHGSALARPWSSRTSDVTLAAGKITELTVKLCDCP